MEQYSRHDRPLISQWLSQVEGDSVAAFIVYCVTAEVRSRRHKVVGLARADMEDRIRNEFKGRADE